MRRAIIVNDIHFPFEDKAAYALFLEVLKKCNPSEIVLNGDILDCYNLSTHTKDPKIKLYFDEEISYAVAKLQQLRALSKRRIVYLEGNHEHRLARLLANQCPQVNKLISLPDILGLKKLHIDWVPFTPNQRHKVLGSPLIARHTPIGTNAVTTINKANCSVIFGHNHQVHEFQKTALEGYPIRAISNGCMCDKSNPAMGYVGSHHQWQLAFSVLTVLDCGTWFNQVIHIIEKGNTYRCFFDGKVYAKAKKDFK